MTDSSDIAARAREWMEVGPDDPGYVKPEREVVEIVASLLAALETAETERDAAVRAVTLARDFIPTLRNLPEIYRHLVMDTPEDQATNKRATEVADGAIDAMNTILGGVS